jgi:SAM-dependent methyltransferase
VPVNSRAWWDARFDPGGSWEANDGRNQTRVFAETLCHHVALPTKEPFTLCDFGCALGDGLKVFRKRYPRAVLFGVDFSATAIARCRAENSGLATFSVASFEDLDGQFDVIYASNILEHFRDPEEKARLLLARCRRLLLMVPFREPLACGPDGTPPAGEHQHSFDERSLEFLLAEGLAHSVTAKVVACPGVWSWTLKRRVKEGLKNMLRSLLAKARAVEPLEVIFDVVRS